ncbi:2-phosphosulfolactate phosphatase [Desmospora profundinema]|uniref:Probable 2-phosphosulfolactate phosphatase n=1 Tax=Desmospora profundinema TaxID=1571184 RepID=A0ABU1ILM7_9BACL|nr:2-phosphosulfolactate phosphatase [Desmospora profundinema]MDR6225680.1 2-phosphosulfolactate phosphatase [Desmospora profundinema]
MKKLRVWMRKEEIDTDRLAGSIAVVIDVLLATTTLYAIVEAGARRVFPVGSMEEAVELRKRLNSPRMRTGGEENGLLIEGFDFGPFPDEFTAENTGGNDIVFLTTNGTRAIAKAQSASRLLLGCLRNAPSVARWLQEADCDDVSFICAGSKGHVSLEDILCAAAILSRMDTRGWKLDDAAWLVREFGRNQKQKTSDILEESRVGRWFVKNGKVDLLRYVGEIGASNSLVEVRDGQVLSLPSRAVR